MCQICVDEGLMTQAELDARRTAGDQTVIPMIELPPEEFRAANVRMVQEAIEAGEDPLAAVLVGVLVAEEYDQIRIGMN
jgi:hypothetical protein